MGARRTQAAREGHSESQAGVRSAEIYAPDTDALWECGLHPCSALALLWVPLSICPTHPSYRLSLSISGELQSMEQDPSVPPVFRERLHTLESASPAVTNPQTSRKRGSRTNPNHIPNSTSAARTTLSPLPRPITESRTEHRTRRRPAPAYIHALSLRLESLAHAIAETETIPQFALIKRLQTSDRHEHPAAALPEAEWRRSCPVLERCRKGPKDESARPRREGCGQAPAAGHDRGGIPHHSGR